MVILSGSKLCQSGYVAFPCCLFVLSRWFIGRVFGIMATVVNWNGRSCGALAAVIFGLMCVTLQGAAFRSAQDVVANGHDTMGSPLLLLDPPMRSKTRLESVLFWSNSYLQFPRANDRWCVQPWGFDEVVHVAPNQATFKEITAKHAQVENHRRTWQSASLTHRKSWSRSQKNWRSCRLRNARSRQSLHREPQISRFWKQRGVTPQRRKPWRSHGGSEEILD